MSFNNEDTNSRANSVQPGEDDVDQDAWQYLRKTRTDASVKTPRKMVTHARCELQQRLVWTALQPVKTLIPEGGQNDLARIPFGPRPDTMLNFYVFYILLESCPNSLMSRSDTWSCFGS
jgi:hypothetical protein